MTLNFVFWFISFVVIFIANSQVLALKCYTCTVNIGDIDQRCVTNPGSVQSGQSVVNCNMEYCTSKRVEYKDPPNKVHSMHRGCESDPEQMNTIIEDDTFISYFRACRSDLCNGGSGKGSDDGIGFDPETGAEGVLLIKGLNPGNKIKPEALGIFITIALVIGLIGVYLG